MRIDFDSEESENNESRNNSDYRDVKNGGKDLTITGVDHFVAGSGTEGLIVTFESKEAEASFNHRFYITPKAFSRIQYLVEHFTGAKLTGQVDSTQLADVLAPKLIGKTKTVVVDAEIRTREKEGITDNNEYPTLRCAGFVNPTGNAAEPIVTDNTVTVSTSDVKSESASVIADFADNTSEDLPF